MADVNHLLINRESGDLLDHILSSAPVPSASASLEGKLIVSCQAEHGDPMDHMETIQRMAASVLREELPDCESKERTALGQFAQLQFCRSSEW